MSMSRLVTVAALSVLVAPQLEAQVSRYQVVRDWMKLPTGWVLGTPTPSPSPEERAAITARGERVNTGFLGFVGVAVDSKDNVYAYHRGQLEPSAVAGEHPVVMFDSTGRFLRAGADCITGGLEFPHLLNIDQDDYLWIVDRNHHRVLKMSHELDRVLLQLGTTGVKGADATHFDMPSDVGFTRSGDILVTDGYVNSRIVKFAPDGRFIEAWGRKGSGDGEFNLPYSVAVDASDRVYVVDRGNKRVQVFDADGKYLTQWTGLGEPWGNIAIARGGGGGGFAYLAEHSQEQILKVSLADGRIVDRWGSRGRQPGQFDWANDVSIDSKGAIYVSDTWGQRVQKFVNGPS